MIDGREKVKQKCDGCTAFTISLQIFIGKRGTQLRVG
jgi:hypothetical protein